MFRTLIRQAVGLFIGAALLAFAAVPSFAQAGTMTLTGLSCGSVTTSGDNVNGWTVNCLSMACTLSLTSGSAAPGNTVTMTANCDHGANAWSFSTDTAGAGCHTPTGAGNTASVREDAAMNCVYRVNATAPGNLSGSATLPVTWAVGAPPAPTGCNEGAIPGGFPDSGGQLFLFASCATPATGIVWSWSRNGVANWSTQQNPTDQLPSNTTQSAINYAYQAKACNGADSFGGANCTIVTPQLNIAVAGSGGGGGGGINCANVPGSGITGNTVVVDFDWNTAPVTLTSLGGGAIGQGDAVVVRFTTGAAGGYGEISAAEYGSPAASRTAILSTSACDFHYPPTIPNGSSIGNTFDLLFSSGANPYGYAVLTPNTPSFLNIKTTGGCGGTCGIILNWHRY